MKLVRYLHEGREDYGFLTNEKVTCLPMLAERYGMHLPDQFRNFIALGMEGIQTLEALLRKTAEKDFEYISLSTSEVTLLSPIAHPPKIICLGLNYRDHAAEQNVAVPDEPIIFIKPYTAIIGPNEKIVKPTFVQELDYEAELAIVIGKQAKNISVSEAESCIFGYTILNDVSARDFQFKDKQWTRGKSFDTFAPTGPCIATRNQIQDTSRLHIRTWINMELRQNSTTRNMVFNLQEIVHHLSRIMTLDPCDIISTGTPAGVGFAMKPRPKFLQAGDIVRIEIEGIGVLENMVTEE